jgi:hypothetical protein
MGSGGKDPRILNLGNVSSKWLALLMHIWEVRVQISTRRRDILGDVSCGFPQTFRANTAIVDENRS